MTRHCNGEGEDAARPKETALSGKGTRRGERPYEKRKKLVLIPRHKVRFFQFWNSNRSKLAGINGAARQSRVDKGVCAQTGWTLLRSRFRASDNLS